MHGQLFVQCMHQHCTLEEVFKRIRTEGQSLVKEYLEYNAHVRKQTYDDVEGWEEERRMAREAQWPEYEKSPVFLSKPAYWKKGTDEDMYDARESEKWEKEYRRHVQYVQEHRQHHIHLPNRKGERTPLPSCRKKEKPCECKHGFPREGEVCKKARVLLLTVPARRDAWDCRRLAGRIG